jgi:Tfp pilus assembly protein PilO
MSDEAKQNIELAEDSQTAETEEGRIKETIDKAKLKSDFRDYVLPAAVYVISIVLIIGLVLPILNSIVSNYQQAATLEQDYLKLADKKSKIENLKSITNTQKQVIGIIDKIIPLSQTAVVDFSEQIKQKAKTNSLILTTTTVRETVTIDQVALGTDKSTDTRLELVELPAEFTISGDFENIKKFLTDLYKGNDFIIIKKMELQKVIGNENDSRFSQASTNQWSMSIILTKYQFRLSGNRSEEELQNTYFGVSESTRPDQAVVDFILKNYGDTVPATTATPTVTITSTPTVKVTSTPTTSTSVKPTVTTTPTVTSTP